MATILEAKDDYNKYVFTDYERELVHKLRTLLRDLPEDIFRSLNTLVEKNHGEHFTDQNLLVYLNWSLGMMNAEPLATNYSLDNFPTSWESTLLLGAEVIALFGESVLQSWHSFSYADGGLSVQINSASSLSGLAGTLQNMFATSTKALKAYLRPSVAAVYSGGQGQVRLRSYSTKMWSYR